MLTGIRGIEPGVLRPSTNRYFELHGLDVKESRERIIRRGR